MIDKLFEWIFDNHPIIFDILVSIVVIGIAWVVTGIVSDYLLWICMN